METKPLVGCGPNLGRLLKAAGKSKRKRSGSDDDDGEDWLVDGLAIYVLDNVFEM